MAICKHCKEEFDLLDKQRGWMANHSRWCKANPKRGLYISNLLDRPALMQKQKKENGKPSNQFVKAQVEGREKPIVTEETRNKLRRASTGRKHSKETILKIKNKALSSKHRRLKKNTIMYKGVMLDSSWELCLAKRLDELGIEWIRPEPLPWKDTSGFEHNYFPDFYLPEYDLYLDPKNKHARYVQREKLKIILDLYDNIIIIEDIEGCKNFSILECCHEFYRRPRPQLHFSRSRRA